MIRNIFKCLEYILYFFLATINALFIYRFAQKGVHPDQANIGDFNLELLKYPLYYRIYVAIWIALFGMFAYFSLLNLLKSPGKACLWMSLPFLFFILSIVYILP